MVQNRPLNSLFLAFFLCFFSQTSLFASWDIIDQDMTTTTGWTSYGETVAPVTFDGKSAWRMKQVAYTYSGIYKYFSQAQTSTLFVEYYATGENSATYPESITITSSISGIAGQLLVYAYNPNPAVAYSYKVGMSNFGWIGTDPTLGSDSWHSVRIVLDGAKAWVFHDESLVAYIDGGTLTSTYLIMLGTSWYGTGRAYYISAIKASTSKIFPAKAIVNIGDQRINACVVRGVEPSRPPYVQENLRFGLNRTGNVVKYFIPYVAIDDPLASNVRVYDGSEVKALQLLPTS